MNLTPSQFPEMVTALAKPGEAILKSLTPVKCDLYHMSDALTIEAAELADAVKRHVIYEKDLDEVQKDGQTLRQNILEELGDMEFYMERIRQLTGFTREETLVANINKLGHRYKGGTYSNDAANKREDKETLKAGVDVYAAQELQAVAQSQGRSFMGGQESTLCGQKYLLSISSQNNNESEIAQMQLDALYDIVAVADLSIAANAQSAGKCELFKKNNGIAVVQTLQESKLRTVQIIYANHTAFTYESQLQRGGWMLANVNTPETAGEENG